MGAMKDKFMQWQALEEAAQAHGYELYCALQDAAIHLRIIADAAARDEIGEARVALYQRWAEEAEAALFKLAGPSSSARQIPITENRIQEKAA